METPYYVLAATPIEQARLRQFFDTSGKVARLLEDPPMTRYASFGITDGGSANLVEGEFLEMRSLRKVLQLYPNGTLIFRALANGDFLSWPQKEEEFLNHPFINPVVVCDSGVSFVRFYKALLPLFVAAPKNLRFRVELRNAVLGNKRLSLVSGGIESAAWKSKDKGNVVIDEHPKEEIQVSVEDVEANSDAVAYRLVEKFYSFFDLDSSAIAYTSDRNGIRVIDVDLFKKV